MARDYLLSDIKILWGEAASRCAFPECRIPLVAAASAVDPKRVVGKIAHIVADSDGGPRADATMSEDDRRREPNLILLCANHHDLVDVQPNTHTVEDLHSWKRDHLAWVMSRLRSASAAVGFAELDRIMQGLVVAVARPVADVAPPTPAPEKLSKNSLTAAIGSRLTIGSLRFDDVEEYVARSSQIDGEFGERLRDGFRLRYDSLISADVRGDELFDELVDWAAGRSTDFDQMAAALAVVTYLFTVCDLFDP